MKLSYNGELSQTNKQKFTTLYKTIFLEGSFKGLKSFMVVNTPLPLPLNIFSFDSAKLEEND